MKQWGLISCFLAALCVALPTSAADEYTSYFKITSITAGISGVIYIWLDEEVINPAGCAETTRYALNAEHENRDAIYSLILTSWTAGKEVRLRVSESECVDSWPKIQNVRAR